VSNIFLRPRPGQLNSTEQNNSCESNIRSAAQEIHQWLYIPLLGPGLFFSFVIFFYTEGRTPWTSDQPVARPLPTHRTTQTQNKHTHRYPCLEWDSNHDPSVRGIVDNSCFQPRGHFNRRSRNYLSYVKTESSILCS
jgi:hypothetical protein